MSAPYTPQAAAQDCVRCGHPAAIHPLCNMGETACGCTQFLPEIQLPPLACMTCGHDINHHDIWTACGVAACRCTAFRSMTEPRPTYTPQAAVDAMLAALDMPACPTCGRKLPAAGAPCVPCENGAPSAYGAPVTAGAWAAQYWGQCDVTGCPTEATFGDEDGTYCHYHMVECYGPSSDGCPHEDRVKWNPYNRVVQCHGCGLVFQPILDEPGSAYRAAVLRAWPQAAVGLPAEAGA